MKDSSRHIIGQYAKVASTFAEAIRLPHVVASATTNIYGRKTVQHVAQDLSILLGKAMCGIRSSAFCFSKELLDQLQTISTFNRMNVPLTIVTYNNGLDIWNSLEGAGAIVLKARGSQQMADLLFIAQVVSEKCLAPVVLLVESGSTEMELCTEEDLLKWFGNADDKTSSPTPAQEITLGPLRRRMPSWFHADNPVLIGARKDRKMMSFEKASQFIFKASHYNELISQTFKQFEALTGRSFGTHKLIGKHNSKNTIVSFSLGTDGETSKSLLKTLKKQQTSLIELTQVIPFPPIEELRSPIERLQVLEPITAGGNHPLLQTVVANSAKANVCQGGWYIEAPDESEINASLAHLKSGNKDRFWLNIPLSLEQSQYPKHEVLAQHIRRFYPNLAQQQLLTKKPSKDIAAIQVPQLIKRYTNSGPPYALINRFNDDVIIPMERSEQELMADPFQMISGMPIATSAYKDRTKEREMIPVFKPEHCADISDLIASCAYMALPSAVFTVEEFLDTAMRLAKENGKPLHKIVPHKKRLIKQITIALGSNEIRKAEDFLVVASHKFLEKLKITADEKQALEEELQLISRDLGDLPVVIDPALFTAREKAVAGSGCLFTLAVNPMSCTACGHCALVGDKSCMQMTPQHEALESTQRQFSRFMHFGQSSRKLIEELIADPRFDSFAALWLDPEIYYSYMGTATSSFNEYETLLRYVLGVTTFNCKPIQQKYSVEISQIIDTLTAELKSKLSNSLPINSLDNLMDVLEKHEEQSVDMNAILGEWGETAAFSALNRSKLERRIQILKELQVLSNLLQKGATGRGRAQFSLVIDASLPALGEFPYNPFNVPVVHSDSMDTAGIALGVCEGQMRHFLDEVRLIRRAKLEVKDSYVPAIHNKELAQLRWSDLDPGEKEQASPVLVFASKKWMLSADQTLVSALLQSDYPVKVVLVDNGIYSTDQLLSELEVDSNSMWAYISHGHAMLSQVSLENTDRVFELIQNSLSFQGNAMMTVLVPDVEYFDIHASNWQQLSILANSTRAFLPWSYNPSTASKSIASKLQAEVDDISSDFLYADLSIDDETTAYPLSLADWLFFQKEFKPSFKKIEKTEKCSFINTYLDLNSLERTKHTPVIVRIEEDGLSYYKVDQQVISATELLQRKLQVLREWSGMYTEYPEKLKDVINEELKAEYNKKQADFEEDLNRKRRDWENNYLHELKGKIKETLLDLSGM